MDNQNSSIESLWDRARNYIETRFELIKLKSIDKVGSIAGGLISMLVLLVVFFMFILLLNIGLALWVGKCLGESYYGFLALAGFYAIIGIIFYLGRNSWIKGPVNNMLIKKLLD